MRALRSERDANPVPTIAIVGCGAIAESFYLPAISGLPVRKRVILVDTNVARARKLGDAFGVESVVGNYSEVMSEVDGVIVAVPHHLHHSIAGDFLQDGVHVLCEKPLAESAASAREMIRLAEDRGATITVNHTRRLMPSSTKVKELIATGKIGRVKSITYLDGSEFNWPTATGFYFDSRISTRGVLLDIGTHVIDLICWWLGGKPQLISSLNDSFGGIEAVAEVELQHEDSRCTIRLSRLSRLPNSYTIEGEKGTIQGGVYDGRTVSLISSDRKRQTFQGRPNEDNFVEIAKRLINNFVAVIKGDASPIVCAQDVLHTAELIDEGYRTARRFPMAWYNPSEVRNGA